MPPADGTNNPKNAESYYSRGNARLALKLFKDAIADYDKTIELNPQHAKAYGNRGVAKTQTGDKAGACADLNKAVGLGNTSSNANQKKFCQ